MTNDRTPELPSVFGFNITVDNVNEALPLGVRLLRDFGVLRVSRGMEFIEAPGPVNTTYRTPQRRVLFDSLRDANPFFHLMESLWILSGSQRVELPAYFLSSIMQFSDDGAVFHGAYGHRLRKSFGFDQLQTIVHLLTTTPDTRQAVMSIWDPEADLGIKTKDMPCNDMVMFSIRDGYLHMTVCNRSNDVIWGAYGANAVQFSMLQEWVAAAVGVNVGVYVQQSNSYHAYPSNPFWQATCDKDYDGEQLTASLNPYATRSLDVFPLAITPEEAQMVMRDCELLSALAESGTPLIVKQYESPFFTKVVCPMIRAYDLYKLKDHWGSIEAVRYVEAADWRLAASEWLHRRKNRADLKSMGGV